MFLPRERENMCFTPWLSLILLGNSTEPTAVTFGKETVLVKDHPDPIIRVAVTDDGKYFFVFDRKGRVRIWNTKTREWRNLGVIGAEWLALSRDGKHIFAGGVRGNGNVMRNNTGADGLPEQLGAAGLALWDTNLKHKDRFPDTVAFLEGYRFPVTAAAFSADGKILATATGKYRRSGEVKIWHVASGKEKLPRIEYKAAAFYGANVKDDLFRLPATFREPPGVELLALSADGSTLATVYESTRASDLGNGTVKLWDTGRGKEKGDLRIAKQPIKSLTFTPDGKMLILGVGKKDAGQVWLWDITTGKSASMPSRHPSAVQALAVSGDGKYLASACTSGVVKLWDIAGRKELHSRSVAKEPEAIWSLAFTPQGKTLMIGGGNRQGWVRLWEIK